MIFRRQTGDKAGNKIHAPTPFGLLRGFISFYHIKSCFNCNLIFLLVSPIQLNLE